MRHLQNTLSDVLGTSLQEEEAFAVAVSGGADSVALALLCQEWAKKKKKKLIALHVDHGLRPESKQEAEEVSKTLASHDIHCEIFQWQGDKPEANIQAEARQARYELMVDYCQENEIHYLLTAHHQQDQAETLLIRLLRGSGVDGLSAMQQENHLGDVHLLRPMLNVKKEELVSYLQKKKVTWLEDPSNQKLDYTRTHVRQFLELETAQEADMIQRLANTADHMQRARSALEHYTDLALQEFVSFFSEKYVLFMPSGLKHVPEEIGLRMIAEMLGYVSGYHYRPRFEKLQHLYQSLASEKKFSGLTLNGCQIAPTKNNHVLFFREHAALPDQTIIQPGQTVIWDGFTISYQADHGEDCTITHLGKQNLKKLGIDTTIPKQVLYTLPKIVLHNEIIAIPHLGYSASPEWHHKFIENTIN